MSEAYDELIHTNALFIAAEETHDKAKYLAAFYALSHAISDMYDMTDAELERIADDKTGRFASEAIPFLANTHLKHLRHRR
jgi:hypothetical protein